FRTENNQHFTCSKLLKEVQLMLPPPKFVRVSKSCLINMDKVSSFKLDTREIIMENGERYQVSVRKVKEIRMLFSVVG
ncbi:MAG: LytTR family DNA-binding domain-containing protein, partial [Salinivirgaceae bacterium]